MLFSRSVLKYVQPLALLGQEDAVEQKRIYIAPDDHTDYFWTAGEDAYRQAFLDMIDYYLDLADETADNPVEHQSRWNCDGSFWMWVYEKHRSQLEFERLIARIRSGHMSIPLNAFCICLGCAPAEAVLRGMYYPGQIERRYNLRFTLAYLMENQTLPYGVVSLLAGSGAKYGWKGICNCDTLVANAGDREHDIYWWTGPDGSRILMKWNSMLGDMTGLSFPNQGPGGYAEARYPNAVVEYVDSDPDFAARYPYRIIGAFGNGWDDLSTMTDEFVNVAQNKTNANRLVRVSNEEDFFVDFEATYGATIPSSGVSYGNDWDLYCATLAEVVARVKRAVTKLRNAETLATLVSLDDPTFLDGRRPARDQAWMDLGLFWEHNWGMVNSPSGLINERVAWQRRLADEIESYVDQLHEDAKTKLGTQILTVGSFLRFYVVNCLSWSRTDFADLPYSSSGIVHVIDLSTGLEVPSQVIQLDGQQVLRILAENVPAVGYKVYAVRPGSGQSFDLAATVSGNVVENEFYSITVAEHGAITSLVDKTRANREFVATIDGRTLNDLGDGSGSIQVEHAGPVSVTILATAPNPLAHTTRITFIRGLPRITIRNDIDQGFEETYTWAFSLDLDNPVVWHEEVGALIRASLLAAGGHYSARNARYDWLTLNHFADISSESDQVGLTLSNADCLFMQLGNSTTSTLDNTPQLKVLVGGRVANGTNGLRNQGGDTYFLHRFALRTHGGYNPVEAMKFALEHQNPFVTGVVTGGDVYPETQFSLLSLSDPDLLLWALKPADDGIDQGLIARIWNLSDSTRSFTLSYSSGAITNAQHVTHIETPLEVATVVDGTLQESLTPHQMRTYLFSTPQPVLEPTKTPANTPTSTPNVTSTPMSTNTSTATPTPVSSETATSTPSSPPTVTPTNSATPTATCTSTPPSTSTTVPIGFETPAPSPSASPVATPSVDPLRRLFVPLLNK
jgi:alpha-mannosidase